MTKSRILISNSHNPWFNLAVEDCIFRSMPSDQRVLFLWRNSETVVIGRAQNPWKECNTQKMEQDEVYLARRQSGGGAVFQDLGNTNFTFMASKPEYSKDVSTAIVLNALQSLGIEGRVNGRNDMVVGEGEQLRKFSGSAYKEAKDRGFHHGTLLLNTDLSRLANYLNPDPKKLKAKGISSVRSRVVNLNSIKQEIDHQMVCDAIVSEFSKHYGESPELEFISPENMPDLADFASRYATQKSWQWNFGKSLQFTHTLEERFSWGGVELHLKLEKAHISESKIFTDSLYPDPLEFFNEQLKGVVYHPQHLAACFDKVVQAYPNHKIELLELRDWLATAIA